MTFGGQWLKTLICSGDVAANDSPAITQAVSDQKDTGSGSEQWELAFELIFHPNNCLKQVWRQSNSGNVSGNSYVEAADEIFDTVDTDSAWKV